MESTTLKKILDTDAMSLKDTLIEPTVKPQGIGMAVAFDWGLAVQILVTPVLTLLLGKASLFKQFSPPVAALLGSLAPLPFAALVAVFGEGVRRGWRLVRPIQVGFNALLFLAGIASLVNVWNGIKNGSYWPVVTSTILLIFSPLIAWRLNSRDSKEWFATVSSTQARKRHGGAWPFLIALWAIVGGILQAIAAMSR
jgi:ACR3 family arsenite efflux pump ArsB